MDSALDEELSAARGLAAEIFTDQATPERVRAVESTDSRTDDELWAALGKAGLIGLSLPEDNGGAGLGLSALCTVLEEQGKRVAPVPLWPSAVAALVIARDGSDQQRRDLLPRAADGSLRFTLALEEFVPGDPLAPTCTARPEGAGWSLTGAKAVVPTPDGADAVLVSAMTPEGPGLFLVDPAASGVTWEWTEPTNLDRSGNLTLEAAPAERVGSAGSGTLERLIQYASVALAALQIGVARGAVQYAVDHTSERKQFGKPLATFQAVAHQLADCYIDIEAMNVTLWNAVSFLEDEEPADRAVLVAKWWATEAGQRVVHRVQHVHGGLGVDTEYPVHRHYLWGKQIAGTLGGPSSDLARLGSVLAAEKETAS